MTDKMIIGAALAWCALPVWADVTTQQSVALDAAGVIKMHGSTLEMTSPDKERRDTEFHCEGFMSLLCGNARSGEIVRLDKDLSWQLRPDKKTYLETAFPTPEERAQAQAKLQEALDTMKHCQKQQASRPRKN